MVETFLLYRPDPFGVGLSRYALANSSDLRFVLPSEIAELSEDIFTYDTSTLIEDLRRNNTSPPRAMIDLGDAIRLSTGISKADGGESKWSFWRRIRRHFQSELNWKSFCALHESRSTVETAGDDELFSELAKACCDLWRELKSELESKDEIARFLKIEVPVSRIFHQRQFHGIAIDVQHVKRCLQSASREKYESYRVVADQIDVSPTGLNYWNVSEHLPSLERSYIDDAATGYKLRDQLKMSTDRSTFARSFTDFMDATRDVDVLTRLSSSEGRTFPTFHSIGTISSRAARHLPPQRWIPVRRLALQLVEMREEFTKHGQMIFGGLGLRPDRTQHVMQAVHHRTPESAIIRDRSRSLYRHCARAARRDD